LKQLIIFRNSACKVSGNGEKEAVIEIPLKGCGTAQVSVSVTAVRHQAIRLTHLS
jgi:hypothetical protein